MKYVVFLMDGMADYPLKELGGTTPIVATDTPNINKMAFEGSFGTFLSLPDEFPTSSDVANMSVLGWDLEKAYTGRGAVECYGAGYELEKNEIAFRMNLITIDGEILEDYSAGHISQEESEELIKFLKKELQTDKIRFESGNTYRNLMFLKGDEFSSQVDYEKPDSSQGLEWRGILTKAKHEKAKYTEKVINDLMLKSVDLLKDHPVNLKRIKEGKNPANMIWIWSGGAKPQMETFYKKYGKKGGIVSAVDVILGIGRLGDMEVVKPEGATGYIDTNYENKAYAAVEILKKNDFVYLHVEAADECSHMGDLEKKMQAIEDIDKRLIAIFMNEFKKQIDDDLRVMVLPDHPVPIELRKHTRDKVPVMFWGKGVKNDHEIDIYSEANCLKGKYKDLKGDELMKLFFKDGEI